MSKYSKLIEQDIIDSPLLGGKSYEAEAPDTLELDDHTKLAINGLGGTIDPTIYYEPYGYKTSFMRHDGCSCTCAPRYAGAFPMMRIMSSSNLYTDREIGLLKELFSAISPDDGLYYYLYRNRHDERL